jgi:predicted small lipoprotein YifL
MMCATDGWARAIGRLVRTTLAVVMLAALVGCGQRGALTLPDRTVDGAHAEPNAAPEDDDADDDEDRESPR